MKKPKTYKCPRCGSDDLLVYESTAWELNSGKFYCHAVKAHDSDAEVICQSCGEKNARGDLGEPS